MINMCMITGWPPQTIEALPRDFLEEYATAYSAKNTVEHKAVEKASRQAKQRTRRR